MIFFSSYNFKIFSKNIGTVILKHANPCGVSSLKNNLNSFKFALSCDPISAYGGIVSCNFKITKTIATELNKMFLEVIIANGFDNSALKILKKKKNLRLINAEHYVLSEVLKYTSVNRTILVQSEDKKIFKKKDFKVVSKRKPSKSQFDDLMFAFNVCKYVKLMPLF